MDMKKAHDVACLMNELDYLRELFCVLSDSWGRYGESGGSRTTVTIPSRWLHMLMDVAGKEIDDMEKGIDAL